MATENSLKIMKNAFCFTLKTLFVLKIFKLLSWRFGHVRIRLDQKNKVNFKIYDVTALLTSNCSIHVLRSEGNQTMKFGHLIKYDMRNIFLEKSYTKSGGETSPRHFSKSKLSISLWINSQKFHAVCFIVCRVEGYRNILKLSSRPLAFDLIFSFLKKAKKGLELVFLSHSLHSFWRKTFILLYSINCPGFIVWLPSPRDKLSNMCIAIVC